jgi:1-acyl-sn-glycerol-3-phosphate acyltransferase
MWYWIGFSCAWILFRIGFRLKVVGKSRIREAWKVGGVLIVANHTSYFDPPVVGVVYGKKTAFLARKTLFKKGFFAWLYPRLNAIPVDQEKGDMTSLKRIIKELRSGNPVLIFPEGERSLDGEMNKGEAGVALALMKLCRGNLRFQNFSHK